MQVDQDRLEELSTRVSEHLAGAMGVLLAHLGDELGLYGALSRIGPSTSRELADSAGADERYVREWLAANAAGGYVEYDGESGRFHMTPEQTLVFASDGSPGCMAGLFQSVTSAFMDHEKNKEVFRSGGGIPWGDRSPCCFCGTERFFRPLYEESLLADWIPALDGVAEKLSNGGRVADVGCGRGRSTVIMAGAFPNAQFFGFDYHAPSIEGAREIAANAGVEDNTVFEIADAKGFAKRDYDLVTVFDALHDMGDPVGIAHYIRSTMHPEGTLMLVEPLAGDRLEDNLHAAGQLLYGFSTIGCTAVSKSQEIGLALGAQAGPARLTQVLREAGFSDVRLAATSTMNIVLEARP